MVLPQTSIPLVSQVTNFLNQGVLQQLERSISLLQIYHDTKKKKKKLPKKKHDTKI